MTMNKSAAPSRPALNRLLHLLRQLVDTSTADVRFDAGSRAAYASEASNYRQVTIGVVLPRTVDDVVAVMEACREADVPVLTRGAGTSMCGQSVNVAVVIDTSRHLPVCICNPYRTRENDRIASVPMARPVWQIL
jgi:hypothetical protein